MRKLILTVLATLTVSACAYTPTHYLPVEENEPQEGDLYGRFLGVTNLYFSDGHDAIMIDAYLGHRTLPGLFFFYDMETDPENVELILERAEITDIDRVFIAHSHFDHALDVATVAKQYPGIIVSGSQKTRAILESDEQITRIVDLVDGKLPLVKSVPVGRDETIALFDKVVDGNERYQGNFKVKVFESPHVQKKPHQRWVESAINYVSDGDIFKEPGTSYSYYIDHPQAKMLVVPSAGYPSSFNDIQADIVFLGIGLLSNWIGESGLYREPPPKYVEQYWQKTVVDTCASVVVPVHWDSPFKKLSTEPKAPINFFDDIKDSVAELERVAETMPGCDGKPVEIVFPRGFKRFKLPK